METTSLKDFKSTIQYSGKNIWVKPVCDFFKLDVQNQYIKIKKDPVLGNLYGKNTGDFSKNESMDRKTSTDLGEIDKNGRILLSKKGFLRWIQIINAKTINDDLRDKFIQYQSLVFDFLYGSLEEEKDTSFHYTRLRKLEKLYSKIGAEIKKEKKAVADQLNKRFLQLSIPFSNKNQIEENNGN